MVHWNCNEIWAMHGLSALSGHSFRIAGTTHLLLLGVDPLLSWLKGGGDPAFLKYWRYCEEIFLR